MTDDASNPLTYALQSLERDLEEAGPRLRSRKEWKAADSWYRATAPAAEGVEGEAATDLVREADAHRDMLALARTETDQRVAAEERTRNTRLAEDEVLLAELDRELRIYGALIVATFLIPPALFAPFGTWCALGALPALYGVARILSVMNKSSGRGWLILQDRVDQVTSRIRFGHGVAGASLLVTVLWVAFAVVVKQAA